MSKANDFVNQWGVFGKTMIFYRWTSLISMILSLIAVMALVASYNQSPLVVVREGNKRHFYYPVKEKVAIKNSDVENFARDFIKTLYEQNGHPCMVTRGLKAKLPQQNLSQYVGKLAITLKKNRTLAVFDLILNIKDVPLVVKKRVELQITQGKKTSCNPIGLYVNGIEEKR